MITDVINRELIWHTPDLAHWRQPVPKPGRLYEERFCNNNWTEFKCVCTCS